MTREAVAAVRTVGLDQQSFSGGLRARGNTGNPPDEGYPSHDNALETTFFSFYWWSIRQAKSALSALATGTTDLAANAARAINCQHAMHHASPRTRAGIASGTNTNE